MELHPILDLGTPPNPGLWYVMSALGDHPSQRVGHTLTYIPSSSGHSGNVYVIGGANPSTTFSEVFTLNLETFSWDVCDHPGLRPRYEHSAFTSSGDPTKIYVFGGADQSRNHNDIQVYDTATQTWSVVTPGGTPPSPRTYHSVVCSGDRFIVYSGGQSGADPVGDRQIHCYSIASNTWSTLTVHGDSPKPRHGHLVATIGNKVIVHGGMSGTTFYDDLHVLDLERSCWTKIKQKKGSPSARAAHSGAVLAKDLYIFGGMNREGALDDFYKLDTETYKWTRLTAEGPAPACRLDMAMCVVRLRTPISTIHVEDTVAASMQAKDVLDTQLRLGSAGSRQSVTGSVGTPSSAGSVRSLSSQPGTAAIQDVITENIGLNCGSDLSPTVTSEPSQAVRQNTSCPSSDQRPHKVVELALIFGGMDTEGEIFDDILVYLLNEEPEVAEGGPAMGEQNGNENC